MILEAFKILITAIVILFAGIGAIVGYESYQDYIKKAGASTSNSSGMSVMPNVVSYAVPESRYKDAPMLSDRDEYRQASLQQMPEGQLVSLLGEVTQLIEPNTVVVSTGMQVAGTNVLDMVVLGYSGQDVLVRFPDRPPYIIGDITSVKGQYLGVKKMTGSVDGVTDLPVIDADYYTVSGSTSLFTKSESYAAR